jgi:hypothetical protein
MIAPTDGLPCLQFEGGRIIAFRRDWLVRSLCVAAARAGYNQWWLADHVAESVVSYLGHDYPAQVIPVTRLNKAVESVLQVIGYAEVARHFAPEPPPVKVCLAEIAHEAGEGYELAFFEHLTRRMEELLGEGITHLEFTDLERCVKHLRARKIWSRHCEGLRSEIVSFVRNRMDSADGARQLLICLS